MSTIVTTCPAAWPRPAHESAPRRWLRALPGVLQELSRRQRLRRLLDLEPRLLDDAGLTRQEIREALALPLACNAAASLQAAAARRRAAERRALRRRKPLRGRASW